MFIEIAGKIRQLVLEWETQFNSFSEEQITVPRNAQNRSIKQIVGHMIDSASNNLHRVVHIQYRELPLEFPNYATHGNNDRWIEIQHFQNENWEELIQLWKYSHFHFCYVIQQIKPGKLQHEWISGKNEKVILKEMVEDFPRHFELHISEIKDLING